MNYRKLGLSGIDVSVLCLGTMMFGGATDEATAATIVGRARESGINFIDTADVYTDGRSEEITGRLMASTRDEWILASKVGQGSGRNRRGLSRRWITAGAEASLRRLGTDRIDILYLHREDHETPLGETVLALGDLVRSGKVLHFGVSNFRSWRVAEICNLCDTFGIGRPVVSQPYYNAMNRMPEVEHLPACAFYGLGVVPYSPLARGILTAKYDPDAPPPAETRAGRNDTRLHQTEWRPESLRLAQTLAQHARERGMTPGQFAFAWVLNNRFVTSAIGGPRTVEQWDDYVGALEHSFTAEDEALVDRLVAAGHPSTPGYNDPAYPIEGRPARTAA